VGARLAFLRDYRAPYRAAALRAGRWRAAPASWSFLALTLLVSLAWRVPPAKPAVALCCAYRASDLDGWPRALRVVGSALLAVRPIEVAWAVVATWLLLAPLEAIIGTRRMLLVIALGNLLPTVAVGLAFLHAHPGVGPPLDVGPSAVVVAAGAALVVCTRSLPIAALYLTGVAVDVLVSPDLATAEHLVALAAGAALALAMRWRMAPSARTAVPKGSGP
jgi:membrane associated rhomboid family serine protease